MPPLAFLCAAIASAAANGQALQHVPADAAAVMWISHLAEPVATTRPATTQAAIAPDPIERAESTLGVRAVALDARRDVAIYVVAGSDERAPPAVVLLLPVTDYAAFLAGQRVKTTDAGVTVIVAAGDGADAFVSRRGDYAAVSRSKDATTGGFGSLNVAPDALAQMATADSAIYVNGSVATGPLGWGRPRRSWVRAGSATTRPTDGPGSYGPSALDRQMDATDHLLRAIGSTCDAGDVREGFGLLLCGQLDYGNALDQLQKAVVIHPDNADFHVALAVLYADLKHPDKAAFELQAAVRIDPHNFDAFHDAGLILLQLGADDRAARMLGEAVRLRPKSAIARSDLGVALVKLKKYDEAALEFRVALALDPKFKAASQNLTIARRLAAKTPATTRAAK